MGTGKSMDYDDSIDALTYSNVAMACPNIPATLRNSEHDNEYDSVSLSHWKSVTAHLLLSNDYTAGSMDESSFPTNHREIRSIASQFLYQCN